MHLHVDPLDTLQFDGKDYIIGISIDFESEEAIAEWIKKAKEVTIIYTKHWRNISWRETCDVWCINKPDVGEVVETLGPGSITYVTHGNTPLLRRLRNTFLPHKSE